MFRIGNDWNRFPDRMAPQCGKLVRRITDDVKYIDFYFYFILKATRRYTRLNLIFFF